MKVTFFVVLCLILAGCTPIAQSSGSSSSAGNAAKVLRLSDYVYESQIKTVQLSPEGAPLLPAVTRLGDWNLTLRFDDLRGDRDTYYARIIHCNYDWTQSDLRDLDFMTTFNEFPINNTEFSVDTHVPYVHYYFTLPGVKYPGNYVVAVYRGSNKEDLILTRRFMVFQQQVIFTNNGNLVGSGSIANINQQINFTVDYKNIDILNPMMDTHVNIRQNQRWDNISTNIQPSFMHEIDKQLDYRFFDDAKMFKGGNEFRFFDMRSLNNPGRNVGYVDKKQKPYSVFLAKDKSRQGEAYSQYNDINGGFTIDNYDYRDPNFTNYAYVNFALENAPIKGDVYVIGAFNNWVLNNESKMRYDSTQHLYTMETMLKQGYYDYQYLVKSSTLPPYYFEGSHFETENYYEIFFYYRPFQPRADMLIGYVLLEKNPR